MPTIFILYGNKASVTGCRWLARGLEKLIGWARMKFKPAKSRSVVIKKGKVVNKFRFQIAGQDIPTLMEKLVKSLGKMFHHTLKDTTAINEIVNNLKTRIKKVDKSGLPGRFKTWLYQHAILPRILWPLTIYSVPISTVESLESKISRSIRKWLGLPRSLSNTSLYGKTNPIQLPVKGTVEELKVSRTREAIMYKNSKDSKVANAGISIHTGKKWDAGKELQSAEEGIKMKAIIGTVVEGTMGLGYIQRKPIDKTDTKEYQKLLQNEVRASVEEDRMTKMVGLS